MLIVETIARIRREHFIKGKTIKEIARDLKVSRNTVRKVLRSGETHSSTSVLSSRGRSWDDGQQNSTDCWKRNAAKSAREQLTLIRIFEELRGRGYDGGYMMPCAVTPGDGAMSVGNRRRRPTSR